jgi:hypothetical protein
MENRLLASRAKGRGLRDRKLTVGIKKVTHILAVIQLFHVLTMTMSNAGRIFY